MSTRNLASIVGSLIFLTGVAGIARADPAGDAYYAWLTHDAATEVKLAQQGNADAQLYLGMMYEMGQGVPKDFTKSVEWFRKSALQGKVNAQQSLGTMYSLGSGVPQDYVRAYMWYNLAAAQGDVDWALPARVAIARQMTPTQLEQGQAMSTRCLASHYKDCD